MNDYKKEITGMLNQAKENIDHMLHAVKHDKDFPMHEDLLLLDATADLLTDCSVKGVMICKEEDEKQKTVPDQPPADMSKEVAAFFTNFVQICEHNIRLDAVCTAYYAHWAMDLMQIPQKRLPSDDAIGGISVRQE